MQNGELMNDISVIDYLGPGIYLLHNSSDKYFNLIAERGYEVKYLNDPNISNHRLNFFLMASDNMGFREVAEVIRFVLELDIEKIVISVQFNKKLKRIYPIISSYFDSLGLKLDPSFYVLNPNFAPYSEVAQKITVILSRCNDLEFKKEANLSLNQDLVQLIPLVRPGDDILIVSDKNIDIDILLKYSKAASVIKYSNFEFLLTSTLTKGYHFIICDELLVSVQSNIIESITRLLLPSGRFVFVKPTINQLEKLLDLDFQLEVNFYKENSKLISNIYHGEDLELAPELSILMKNPLSKTIFPYQETIYGYSSPPKNLLEFQRDYSNPWILRGIVEFPFRNRSRYQLQRYSKQILEIYNSLSPDYGAALAVLGYQYLDESYQDKDIIDKIEKYCANLTQLDNPSPHQIRWYISLSTLLGVVYNKHNIKNKALSWFAKASRVSESLFSPSIGTKILQSYYFQCVILLSQNKLSCAEIILERGIKRGVSLFYNPSKELIGLLNNPFNFVMYIYHDIIDWLIKLINLKKAIYTNTIHTLSLDNSHTWSSLIRERMHAISEMSNMIAERDKSISSQKVLIDERDMTISCLEKILRERESAIESQTRLIDERDNTINHQNQLIFDQKVSLTTHSKKIADFEVLINQQKLLLVEKDHVESNLRKEIYDLSERYDESLSNGVTKDKTIQHLNAELEYSKALINKMYGLPIIGRLFRFIK